MNLQTYLSCNGIAANKFASLIDVPPPLLSQWRNNVRPVPIEKCVLIERATNGQVTRQELRPSDWMDIWPELVKEAA